MGVKETPENRGGANSSGKPFDEGESFAPKDRASEPRASSVDKLVADFQCFVCGAVFTTDEDRAQHLEKEAHGRLHEEASKNDSEIAQKQAKLNENHEHRI